VSFKPVRRSRVLLGNLEPMMRLGVSRVLAEDDVDVVSEEESATAIVAEARRLRPDAVVLSLTQKRSRELGEEVRAAAPETTVILLARDESTMEILGPGGSEPRRIETAVSDALRSELRTRLATGERT
jgi:AmiR/NasT family two-component response regulator